ALRVHLPEGAEGGPVGDGDVDEASVGGEGEAVRAVDLHRDGPHRPLAVHPRLPVLDEDARDLVRRLARHPHLVGARRGRRGPRRRRRRAPARAPREEEGGDRYCSEATTISHTFAWSSEWPKSLSRRPRPPLSILSSRPRSPARRVRAPYGTCVEGSPPRRAIQRPELWSEA